MTTFYAMIVLSTQVTSVLFRRICLFGLEGREFSNDLGWRFLEHFVVRIICTGGPEMLSSPVSARGLKKRRWFGVQEGPLDHNRVGRSVFLLLRLEE